MIDVSMPRHPADVVASERFLIMCKSILKLLFLGFIVGCSCAALAQTDEVSGNYAKLSPEETKAARAALAEPAPTGALTGSLVDFFLRKENLARKLGDNQALIALYREWLSLTPDKFHYNAFANELYTAGQIDEAMAMRRESIKREKNKVMAAFYRLNYAFELFRLGRYDESKQALQSLIAELDGLESVLAVNTNPINRANNQVTLKNTQAGALRLESTMDVREGKSRRLSNTLRRR